MPVAAGANRRREESNAGDSSCACSQAVLGIDAGHAAQGKYGYAFGRGTSPPERFEALGCGLRACKLLENRREEHQVHLFFPSHMNVVQSCGRVR